MLDPHVFNRLFENALRLLPKETGPIESALVSPVKAMVEAILREMDCVTREEFDIQTRVLARTRALYEDLSKKVTLLEARSQDKTDT